jgi:hypothetical protein
MDLIVQQYRIVEVVFAAIIEAGGLNTRRPENTCML